MLNQAHQRFEAKLTSVQSEISLWQLAHGPLFTVLQVSHANNAEVLPQDAGCLQQIVGVRIARIAAPFRPDGRRADNRNRFFVRKLSRAKRWQTDSAWLNAELLAHGIEYRATPQMLRSVENTFGLAHVWRPMVGRLRAVLVLALRSQRGIAAHRQNG